MYRCWSSTSSIPRKFSPQAWGCTGIFGELQSARGVFPTGVGVYRGHRPPRSILCCFPHRRGGVPTRMRAGFAVMRFSPQAWGCTGSGAPAAVSAEVFPTGVGVYRWSGCRRWRRVSFPHRRGGVPRTAQFDRDRRRFSPQAWGCTEKRRRSNLYALVFPTGVGVYRRDYIGN